MNMVKSCFPSLIFVLALFLLVQASSFNDKPSSSSKFVKHMSGYSTDHQTLIKQEVELDRNSFKSGSYYHLGSTRWPTTDLTWALEYRVGSLNFDPVNPISSAFQSWADVTNFVFTKIDNYDNASVKIRFTLGSVFLANPDFLAYAYFPPQGLLYFKTNVNWTDRGEPEKMDLESVAVHELGHILGLNHTGVPFAVMYRYSFYGVMRRNLHEDDILGIRALYNIT